jgi:isoquinoline 1-oxidoreductase alpha subunit
MPIETIESLAADGHLNAVQQAWLELDVPQCGYCQSGQIMAATALVRQAKTSGKPSQAVLEQQLNNICRCGTYNRIRPALDRAFDLAYEA